MSETSEGSGPFAWMCIRVAEASSRRVFHSLVADDMCWGVAAGARGLAVREQRLRGPPGRHLGLRRRARGVRGSESRLGVPPVGWESGYKDS